ncbi:flagellar basal body-associated FliL family protein, partial [Tateyamaria sp.]
YVKMSNQFVVPIVDGDSVKGLVVMSLTLEVIAGQKDAVYTREPKLRDSFLQVMFDHANIGGFDGAFTNASNLAVLRGALLEVSQKVMGKQVTDVLIVEIARQDY